MLTSDSILSTLDNCDKGSSWNFIRLDHPYVYLIDCRINLFRDISDKWAIVCELLGYNNRASACALNLEIRYFGNCLQNLEVESGKVLNYYQIPMIPYDNFINTIDQVDEVLKPNAEYWLIRNLKILHSHKKQDYLDAGIERKELEPDEISGEEAARLVVQNNRDIFRATDEELYKSIPKGLDKILVIDEWHHTNFAQIDSPFENPEFVGRFDLSIPMIKKMVEEDIAIKTKWNREQWEMRPSNCEIWQQIANVLVTGDTMNYHPALPANTHWRNWPEGGSM